MTKIIYDDQRVDIFPEESVLDALIRLDKSPNFQCKKGVCQSCIMQLEAGKVPQRAKENLLFKYQEKGFFLACLCYPEEDIIIKKK